MPLGTSPSSTRGDVSGTSPQNYRSVGKAGKRSAEGPSQANAVRSGFESDSEGGSVDIASPNLPGSPELGQNSDSDGGYGGAGGSGGVWADDKLSSSSSKTRKAQVARQKYQRSLGQSADASASELSVDTANVPSNDPLSPQQVGPTPLNTPTFSLARRNKEGPADPLSPTIPRKPNATGALVAPRRDDGVRVPLAHDYVDEDEGGLIGRAVEIVNTARDLIGALLGTGGDRARSWRE